MCANVCAVQAKDEEPPNDEEIMQEMRMRQRELSRRDDAIARLEEEKSKMMELVQQANTRIDAVAEEEERLRVLADEAKDTADKKVCIALASFLAYRQPTCRRRKRR